MGPAEEGGVAALKIKAKAISPGSGNDASLPLSDTVRVGGMAAPLPLTSGVEPAAERSGGRHARNGGRKDGRRIKGGRGGRTRSPRTNSP